MLDHIIIIIIIIQIIFGTSVCVYTYPNYKSWDFVVWFRKYTLFVVSHTWRVM